MEATLKMRQLTWRTVIFIVGLLIMSFGIVLLIEADLGSAPWDVLNIGLYYQLGLTIGSWTIIVGFFVLFVSAILSKSIPQIGAFLNMLLVGIFIDLFLMMPFIKTPPTLLGREVMFLFGLVIMAYGMGFYISANLGAGPRDSLMLVLSQKLGLSISKTRFIMEAAVLFSGWLMGGPVFWGTVAYAVIIGKIAGFSIPQCRKWTELLLANVKKSHHRHKKIANNRSAGL
ncbi:MULTISPECIES: YitT family protein [unclassified Niallia]|uniref:YczE/YyaS/YitT family protein n=1 Tax=unclassified Niallia TaxID=2837522 RepID=UPI001EDAD29F|nr:MULTISPECIES: YitT family protein [unclassified Niallia]MDL0437596.1 YitT family protein [Niallia sp. SS-2023]UPO86679.1 YitT family protein [Niallia sp. Man26]